jgi:hypothetical protein
VAKDEKQEEKVESLKTETNSRRDEGRLSDIWRIFGGSSSRR